MLSYGDVPPLFGDYFVCIHSNLMLFGIHPRLIARARAACHANLGWVKEELRKTSPGLQRSMLLDSPADELETCAHPRPAHAHDQPPFKYICHVHCPRAFAVSNVHAHGPCPVPSADAYFPCPLPMLTAHSQHPCPLPISIVRAHCPCPRP